MRDLRTRRRGTALLIGVAWVDLVVGHLLAYALTAPTRDGAGIHVAEAAHGWVDVAVTSLILVLPLVLAWQAARALRSSGGFALAPTTLWLAVFQTALFLSLEAVERGLSIGAAAADPAVGVGLVIQVLLAAIAALALHAFTGMVRAVVRLLRARRPSPRRSTPYRASPGVLLAPRHAFLLGTATRAPPPR